MLGSGARLVRGLLALAGAALIMAAPAIGAQNHSGHPRPDLVVSGGTVSARGHRMTGNFTVRNRGTARAARSRAEINLFGGTHNVWTAGVFPVRAMSPSQSRVVRFAGNEPQGLPTGTFRVSACADSGRGASGRCEA